MAGFSRRNVVVGGALAALAAFDAGRQQAPARAAPPLFAASDYPGLITVASSADFPGIDPTGASDSSNGLQAALDAAVDGGLVIVPAGTYLLSKALAPKGGRTLRLQGYGARLITTTDTAAISLRGQYDTTFAVGSIQTATQTFASGASELTSVVTVVGSPAWSSGDVVKIVSDDPIDGAREPRNRRGEFATVFSRSGSTVTLVGRLRESYSQGVRIARISRQSIVVEGFEVQVADARLGQVGDALLSFSRLFAPLVVDVKVLQSSGPAMRFSSCLGYRVENADVAFAMDDSSRGILGYGVLDNSSAYGRVEGGTYRHVRHAYTDDTLAINAGDSDLGAYGRTYGTVVTGVNAAGTTGAAFSTHHSSEGVHFDSCRATSAVPVGSSAVGFELRGLRHRVTSCTAVGMSNGVLIRTESGGGESRGHVVADFRAERMTNAAVRLEIHGSGHPQARKRDSELNVRIENVSAVDCLRLVYAENSRFSLSGGHYLAPSGTSSQLLEGFFVRNCEASLRDVVLDYTENAAGKPRPIITGSSTGFSPGGQETSIDGLEVRITPEAAARGYFVFGGAENKVFGSNIRLTHPFPRVPGESHPDTSWTWSVDARPGVAGAGSHSAYFAFKATALSTQLAEVLKSNDPEVWIHLDTEGKTLQVAELPAGRRRGQRWTFFQSSSGTVQFASGGSSRMTLKAATGRTLWKGRRLDLVWDGATWHEPVGL